MVVLYDRGPRYNGWIKVALENHMTRLIFLIVESLHALNSPTGWGLFFPIAQAGYLIVF